MRSALALAAVFAAGCPAFSGCPLLSDRDGSAAAERGAERARDPAGVGEAPLGDPENHTRFDFEPLPDEPERPPILDGVPDVPEELRRELEPYLDVSRARITGVGPGGGSLFVLSRRNGAAQVYEVTEPGGELEALTEGRHPIEQASVLGGGREVVLRRDRGGDEMYQVVRRDVASGQERALSAPGTRSASFRVGPGGQVAFPNNRRSPYDMDIYRAREGDVELLFRREGRWFMGGWGPDGRRVLLRRYRSISDSELFIADTESLTVQPLPVEAPDAAFRGGRFLDGGEKVAFTSDFEGDTLRGYELDLETEDVTAVTQEAGWDVERVAYRADGRYFAYSLNAGGESELYIANRDTGEHRRLPGLPDGVIRTLRFAAADALALTLSTPTRPDDAYTYDLRSGELTDWTDSALADDADFARPERIRAESFDGLEIPAFVYLPEGQGPHPAIVWVHGGPEGQHRPRFNPILQYFVAEREIAVVAPNIRGSDGYGARYRSLDDGRLRLDAVRDIGAILDWIEEERADLDGDRVGIHGASYGGYIVLASVAEFGDRIAAGSNLVGISHFVTFLENTAAYRRDQRRAEYGDERDPEMRAFLHAISPLTNAAQIESPLLVGHGENDPRVPVGEAEQIVEAVRARDVPSWYVLAPDEGHGLRMRRNRDAFYAAMALFFERKLADEPDY